MDGIRTPRRRYLFALALMLSVTALSCVPPISLPLRLDRLLYDTWAVQSPAAAPGDIMLIELDDTAWLTTLVAIAQRDGARALITTVPQPPSPAANKVALGPTEMPLGNRLLRRTEWRHGGHLWFRPETDGVIRQDFAYIDDQTPIRSLAAAAAAAVLPSRGQTGQRADAVPIDGAGRHWLKFFAPHSFRRLTPLDLLNDTGRLTDLTVIAGSRGASLRTPLGDLAPHELLAQAFAGRATGQAIRTSRWASSLAWAVAGLALLAPMIGRPFRRRRALLWPMPAALLLALANAGGFLRADLFIPVAAPLLVLLGTSGLFWTLSRTRRRTPAKRPVEPADARRLAALGRHVEAWQTYRNLPPSKALLAELYELGCELEGQGHTEHAADVFHRIAQTDARFRDASRRLALNGRGSLDDQAQDDVLPMLELPTQLGRYELLELIGQGTTGQVFLGRDPKINRIVAVKVINLSSDCDPDEVAEVAERFRREAEAAGRLSHPNIVTVHDIGESNALAYIAMEYLKGRHLCDFTDSDRLLPPTLALELTARTAEALQCAHEQNVVHRDIKPANIMYDSVSDSLKITDFGIARLIDVSRTRTGIVLGTPSFMAPEQLEGENVNGHTDLFALGVSLYQLLTGQLPFRGASMTKLMFVIANEPHQPVTEVRSGLPEQLNSLFERALAKDPRQRFDSGIEMAEALRAIAVQMA